MPNRVPDINSSIYTDTNPENIISAKKGALFFRRDNNFYINRSGNVTDEWIRLAYNTVILPRPNPNKLILYKTRFETWKKTTDGLKAPWVMGDRIVSILPKTGWKLYSEEDEFVSQPDPRPLNWIFPVPNSSYDPIGSNNNRSYDDNFFYAKTGSMWFRTPITLYTFPGSGSGENSSLYDNLPFVAIPRAMPVPSSSYQIDTKKIGDQTYDADFFYIKLSIWKRSPLSTYTSSTMTLF